MRTNPKSYYELLTYGLGGNSFQQFVDKFKLKYDKPQTDGYVYDPEIQIGYTYEQLLSSLNVATLPVYMDERSEALDKQLGSFSIGSNKVPTQKHRYPIDTRILREKMIAVQKYGEAALNSATKDALLELQFDSVDKLIAGNHNALTHQRMQVNSTGQFTISATNNARGITGITFDFNIPSGNKTALSGSAKWWTSSTHVKANEGADSDPVRDLKKMYKNALKNGYPAGHIEMSQALFDDLVTHSKVLGVIGLSLYPTAASETLAAEAAKNMTDAALKAQMERIVGCPIKVYDTYAFVEAFDASSKQLKTNRIENFKKENVSFIPDGNIGTIKSVQQLVMSDDPTQNVAWFDGGRTLIRELFDAHTNSMYVESEFAMLCVPNMPYYMVICTVTD